MQHKQPLTPIAVMFIGILAVSSASIFIRFTQTEVSSIVIAAYRLTLAVLILMPFCIKQFIAEVVPATPGQKGLLLLSGAFLALHFYVWISSLEYTSVASSVVLVATSPLWVALFSPLILKEKSGKWTLIGLAVALTGSVIVGMSSLCMLKMGALSCGPISGLFQGKAFIGDLLALAGAFFSCGYLIVGRKVQQGISFKSYVFSVYGLAAILLVLLAAISGQRLFRFSGTAYLLLIALAVIPQLIGHSSFNWALKVLPATFVAIALLGEPIGTVILSMIFLKENPGILEVSGGVLILTGIVLASRLSKIKVTS
jgi:drug/metabolite transporter (DMT)-like permease